MTNYTSYLEGRYNHENWVTFEIPGTGFSVNLFKGTDQEMTQKMTFEIGCDSMEELEKIAQKHDCKIKDFVATETANNYKYYYFNILGPHSICKVEVSYSEDI